MMSGFELSSMILTSCQIHSVLCSWIVLPCCHCSANQTRGAVRKPRDFLTRNPKSRNNQSNRELEPVWNAKQQSGQSPKSQTSDSSFTACTARTPCRHSAMHSTPLVGIEDLHGITGWEAWAQHMPVGGTQPCADMSPTRVRTPLPQTPQAHWGALSTGACLWGIGH